MSRPSIEMNLPPSLLNFYQKQQEYAGLQALREASADLVARAEKLAEMSNIMADGGEGKRFWWSMMEDHYLNCIAIGGVLRNWPHVFSILSLFSKHEPIAKTYDKLIHAFSGPNGKIVWRPLTAGRRGGRRTFALPCAFSIRRRNALRRVLRTDDHHRI